jgi:probable phosphoglycerate mutase
VTRFLLIRHGLTDAVGRTLTGTRAGVHLNDVGRVQVARLAERLRDVPLAALVSSPLERAMETAAAIAAGRGLAIETTDAFIEFEVGDWSGRTFESLDQTAEWQRFNAMRSQTRPPGGELMLDVQRRAIAALLHLHTRYPNGIVGVVSHGDVIRAMLLYVLGVPIDLFSRLEVSPSSVSIVELSDGPPRVWLVNGDSVPEAR